jgi:hypothetical protein
MNTTSKICKTFSTSSRIYKHSVGILFRIPTDADLTDSIVSFLVKKPSNKSAIWSAAIYGDPITGMIEYTTATGDLDDDGFYYLQAYAEFPTGNYYGETLRFRIYDSYEVP